MRLSISNIGWDSEYDEIIYNVMKKYGYTGLEIAPTRVFPESPYSKLEEAADWKAAIHSQYGFSVSSMQSIWYGRQEKIFGSDEERRFLLTYTKKAIDFAAIIGCKNLVFGCPRNRNLPQGGDDGAAIDFFRELGEYALEKGTVIGMEANPPIYNTNYINDTVSALDLIRRVNSDGFLLNLDVGTMIQNREDVSELKGNVSLINHVHISEPGLKPIENRLIHAQIRKVLLEEKYSGYISIEMGNPGDLTIVEDVMKYVKEVYQ